MRAVLSFGLPWFRLWRFHAPQNGTLIVTYDLIYAVSGKKNLRKPNRSPTKARLR